MSAREPAPAVAFSTTDLVGSHRIVLCGGTGGVGKTTLSAALGVFAAERGLRTLVLTIDPARRLAQAMGLESLDSEPQQVPGRHNLAAMMLDPGATFDDLVRRHAPDDRVREAILGNAYYQRVSSSVSGSREFMAMEKVFSLAEEGDWDLLVVDTPPSQHAMDFIDAPQRLLELLDGSGFSLLANSARTVDRLSLGFARRGRDTLLRMFETFTGHRVLIDLTEFMDDFARILDDFRERSRRVSELLRSSEATFLTVTTPVLRQLDEAARFCGLLHRQGIRLGGVVINQTMTPAGVELLPVQAQDMGRLERGLTLRLAEATASLARDHLAQQQLLLHWATEQGLPVRQVPRLAYSVASGSDLEVIASYLDD